MSKLLGILKQNWWQHLNSNTRTRSVKFSIKSSEQLVFRIAVYIN